MFYQLILKKLQQKSLKTKVRKMLMYLGNRNTNLVSLEGWGEEPCTLHVGEKEEAIIFQMVFPSRLEEKAGLK